jgi:hypothetical protein
MRTMLMSTAAIGLVAILLTGPAQADRVCARFVTTASVKASACLVDLASICTRVTVTIIGATCTDQA